MRFFTRLLAVGTLIASLSLLSTNTAEASHAMGADLTYSCLGQDANGNFIYEFQLTFYRDCNGIAAPTNPIININSTSCASTDNVTAVFQGSEEVSQICDQQLSNTTCNGGSLQGVEAHVYTVEYTFPFNCNDWVISFSECCRNAAITNSNNAQGFDLYVEALINNKDAGCNSSPEYTTLPIPYICAGQPFEYNHGAVDTEGDSLVYTLIDPFDDGTATVPYLAPFNATYPIGTLPANSFGFDAQTGQMSFTPSGTQIGIVTVLVEEYRNNVLIGTTIRDMQVVVINCTNTNTQIDPPTNISTNAQLNGSTFNLCGGEDLSFSIEVSDPDVLDSLSVSSNIATAVPGATITTVGTNPLTINFNWNSVPAGSHQFSITISDNACPTPSLQTLGFDIFAPGVIGLAVDQICTGFDTDVQLTTSTFGSAGGGTYSWTPAAGLSCSNCPNPIALDVNTPSVFVVTYTDGVCSATDSVFIVPDSTSGVIATASQTIICPQVNNTINLTAAPTYNGGAINGNFTWTGPGLSNPNIQSPTATIDQPGQYIVFYDGPCGGFDTIDVTTEHAIDAGPDIQTCGGATVQLDVQYDAPPQSIPCQTNPGVACFDTPVQYQYGTGGTTSTTFSPFEGFWEDSRMQVIYTAADLTAAGVVPGLITEMSLNVALKGSTQPYSGFNINMGCTTDDQLAVFQTGLQNVFTANYTTTAGWNSFALTTPYGWDGTSNLVIEFCFDNASWTDDDDITVTATPGLNSTIYDFTDGATGCLLNAPATVQSRPDIRLTTCGLQPPATYTWTGPNLSDPNIQNPTATPTGSGTYIVVADDGICTLTDTVEVTATTVNFGTPQVQNESCAGANDGTIIVSPTGGQAPFTYQWFGGSAAGQTNDTLTGLPAGNYGVLITDFGGCTDSIAVSILAAQAIQTSTSFTGANCGATDGSATVSPSGGSGAYTYTWSTVPVQNTQTATSIGAGQYAVTVTDANGCATIDSVEVTNTTPLNSTISTATLSCFGDQNASLTITPLNGVGPYTYQWDGGNATGQTGATATGLGSGFYFATVTDANGCVDFHVAPINPVDSISIDTTFSTGVACNSGSTGSATILASGGTGALTYTWATTPVQTGQTATNLAAATYTVTIEDANGCSRQEQVTVSQNSPVQVSPILQNNVSCNGGNNGEIDIAVTGGTYPYTYSWTGAASGFTDSLTFGLPADTYTVTVTDAAGCIQTAQYTVTEPAIIVLDSSATTATCAAPDGSASAIISGGVYPYTYLWSPNAASQTDSVATNLTAGNYSVTITDANNCLRTLSVTVPSQSNLQATSAQVNPTCNGFNNGSITVTPSNGNGPYSYQWSSNTGGQIGQSAVNLTAGLYTVTVTDADGCTFTLSETLSQPDPISLVPSGTDASCAGGQADGTTTVVATGGDGNFSYQWSQNTGNQQGPTATGLSGGTYSVTVTDGNNCSESTIVTIGNPAPFSLDGTSSTPVTCGETNNGSVSIDISGATPGYIYDWSNGGTGSTLTNVSYGSYTVTVTDANGCQFVLPTPIQVDSFASVDVTAFVQDDTIGAGATTPISAILTDAVPGTTYQWFPPDGIADPSSPITTASPTSNETYVVTATSPDGCVDTAQVRIVVIPGLITFSNAFAPTGIESANQTFGPITEGIIEIETFEVYNRWGELMFRSTDGSGWDGTYKGEIQPMDVYVYYCVAAIPGQPAVKYKGDVTLVR